MRELRDILDAFQTLRETGEAGVLASAVRTEGPIHGDPGT